VYYLEIRRLNQSFLNTLAQNADLIVRPRSSSFAFKATQTDSKSIGRHLDVAHVLEGSVRKAGDRLRISAQLVEVSTNRPIWSGRFDRRLTDIFEVQDEISSEILAAVDVLLSSRRAPRQFTSEKAYEAFLRARYAFSQYSLKSAEDWLAKTVELDPGNAEAWALRADVNAYQSASEIAPNDGVHRDRRRGYVEQALSIDPAHPNALAVRALMDTHYTERDYQTAINQLVELASIHPNNDDILVYLTFPLATIGRASLVDRVTERLVRVAPRSPNAWVIRILYGRLLFGDVDEAKADLARFPAVNSLFDAEFALAEGNPSALVDFVPKGDVGGGVPGLYAALVPYLQGDFDKAKQLAVTLKRADGYQSYRIKALASLVERDVDGALAHYRDAILAAETTAISQVHGPASWRRIFPEFFSDRGYLEMLEEFKLDPNSTSRIQVPDLPF
jgi:tetratricopeptide (TPR) repeat protein